MDLTEAANRGRVDRNWEGIKSSLGVWEGAEEGIYGSRLALPPLEGSSGVIKCKKFHVGRGAIISEQIKLGKMPPVRRGRTKITGKDVLGLS